MKRRNEKCRGEEARRWWNEEKERGEGKKSRDKDEE